MSGKKHGITYWLLFGWWWEAVVLWFKAMGWLIKGIFNLISHLLEISQNKRESENIAEIEAQKKQRLSIEARDSQVLQKRSLQPFRDMPLNKIMDVADYVVLDLETTGLDNYDRITEIAAIKFENNKEIDRYCTLINPEITISKHITDLTGITNADVQNAPKFKEIADELNSFLCDLPIVAHNAEFDAGFLHRAFKAAGLFKTFDCIDTVALAKIAFPGIRRYRLETLCTALHITNQKQSHRALDDAERVMKLFSLCRDARRNGWTIDDLDYKHRAYLNSLVIHPKDFKPEGKVDPKSKLYKKTIAFTGDFSVDRKTMAQKAVNAGAVLRVNVTPTLDYLVIGKPNEAAIGYDGISRKEKDAHALMAEGNSKLSVLSESDFEQLIVSNSDTAP